MKKTEKRLKNSGKGKTGTSDSGRSVFFMPIYVVVKKKTLIYVEKMVFGGQTGHIARVEKKSQIGTRRMIPQVG